MIKLAVFAAAFAVLCAFAACPAGEKIAPSINPTDQPLIVLRVPKPAALETLLAAEQPRILGLTNWDFSGKIPGLGVRLESLRGFMGALEKGGFGEFWYCLSQSGGSLASQAAAFGFDFPEDRSDPALANIASWLEKRGVEAGGLHLERSSRGDGNRRTERFTAAGSAAVIAALIGTGGGARASRSRNDAWRTGLDDFLRRDFDGTGVWFNPRPLFGIASLTTGLDFRGEAAKLNLNLPDAVEAEIRVPGTDNRLGIALRLYNLLPKPWNAGADSTLDIPSRDDAHLTLSIPAPYALLEALGVKDNPLFPANLDLRSITPRIVSLSLRRDADGWHWTLICLTGDRERFVNQMKRLRAWLEVAATSPASPLTLGETRSPGGDKLVRIECEDFSLVAGMADCPGAGGGGSFAILAGSAEDYPDVFALSVADDAPPRLVSWDIRLDEITRGEIAGVLAELAFEYGVDGITGDALRKLLADDEGALAGEGTTLSFRSRSGSVALLAPALAMGAVRTLESILNDPVRMTATRLRFLLNIASQSRYREIGPGRLVPESLPDSMAMLSLATDPEARRWLDRAFPRFPGQSQANSAVLRSLASGRSLDGYRYRISLEGSDWVLLAENGNGDALRLDAAGVMERYRSEAGTWEPFRELLPSGL